MQAYGNVIVIIPYTSSRRERMSCLWFVARGEEGHRGRRGISGPKAQRQRRSRVGREGKGSEGKGWTNESASLSFVVQMLAATVGAGRGS